MATGGEPPMCSMCQNQMDSSDYLYACGHTVCKYCFYTYFRIAFRCPRCGETVEERHENHYDELLSDFVDNMLPTPPLEEDSDDDETREPECWDPDSWTLVDGDEFLRGVVRSRPASPVENLAIDRPDPKILLKLIALNVPPLAKQFVLTSRYACVVHLKKLLAKRILQNVQRYNEFEIVCNYQVLQNGNSLGGVFQSFWRNNGFPMVLKFLKVSDED
ncbi:polycomb group RING finger protein 5-A-like [Argiope bruennichi]|uniref:Polycomb group RING finger protein 5-A like protein n=1 Tax=Argiope bruennichi TaxID=94029 RepID=A0A8T0FNR4_ARGBR|nr:polycomb group RING finger protein 5-A-like [Argiope bruennichi]XP_055930428.1 polycomb group RING finger protein 5-A-like [Argiope bruennichi]KAF8791249.1 Polycomb group RING finger protein 5-A like protein [Argiope bruennichi]